MRAAAVLHDGAHLPVVDDDRSRFSDKDWHFPQFTVQQDPVVSLKGRLRFHKIEPTSLGSTDQSNRALPQSRLASNRLPLGLDTFICYCSILAC